MNMNIQIKQVGPSEYDIKIPNKKQDGHLRFENEQWVIDIFNLKIKNREKAHIETVILDKGNHSVITPDWNSVFEFIFA